MSDQSSEEFVPAQPQPVEGTGEQAPEPEQPEADEQS